MYRWLLLTWRFIWFPFLGWGGDHPENQESGEAKESHEYNSCQGDISSHELFTTSDATLHST
jgi:hypothetical protein